MAEIVSYTVISVRVEIPRRDFEEIGGRRPLSVVLGSPKIEIEIQIPVAEADRVELMACYADGRRVEFHGEMFTIVEPAWRRVSDEDAFVECTFVGSVPSERLAAFEEVLRQPGPDWLRAALAEEKAEEKVQGEQAARMVQENRSLGTVDDLT